MNLLKRIIFTIILVAGLPTAVLAEFIAVLETAENPKGLMTLSERQYITNVLREIALQQLPAEQNYTIMTRENINAMLPPGKSLEDCEGSCVAETGRNISADFVAQAVIGKFGEDITINVELYETASNKLVASANGRSQDLQGLADFINEKTPALFSKAKRPEPAADMIAVTAADTIAAPAADTIAAPAADTIAIAAAPATTSSDSVRAHSLAPSADTITATPAAPISAVPATAPSAAADEPDSSLAFAGSDDLEEPRFRHGPWIHFGQYEDSEGLIGLGQAYEAGYTASLRISKWIDIMAGVSFEILNAREYEETCFYSIGAEVCTEDVENVYSVGLTIPLAFKIRTKVPVIWYTLGYKFRLPSFVDEFFNGVHDVTGGIGLTAWKFDIQLLAQVPIIHSYFEENMTGPQMGLTLTYWIR